MEFEHVGVESKVWACCLCLLLLLALCFSPPSEANYVGVCYGRDASDIPSPLKVTQLLQSQAIPSVRLFDANPVILRSLAYTGIGVVVEVANSDIPDIAQSEVIAYAWVSNNVAAFVPTTRIIAIAVGSEVITSPFNLSSYLVPAMSNLNSALITAGFSGQVKVSTPHAMGIIQNSSPPSSACFYSDFLPVIQPLLSFLSQTNSFLMMNIYPFYTYQNEATYLPLDYVLFQAKGGFEDSKSGLIYFNLFDAQVDAVFYALQREGYGNLSLVITETGWPCQGYAGETDVVNFQNAATYNGNLIRHILSGNGTPLKPGIKIATYIFELFNEDLLSGQTANRNWGLFRSDGTKYYDFSFGEQGNSMPGGAASPPGGIPIVNRTFCIASNGASFTALQTSLDWACGPGHVDCSAIQPGHACFLPDSIASHASYAFNSYYQNNDMNPASCKFSGLASITSMDPSYGDCVYEGSYLSRARSSVGDPLGGLRLLTVFVLLYFFQQQY